MHILKRKRGKNEYYYLQYSYRGDGKVITKEKYLGKTIPSDIENIKNSIISKQKKAIYVKLGAIKKDFHKEWKRIPKTVKEEELKEIALSFTYNTNAIEGSTITLEETREILNDKIAPKKSLRDIKETEAHYKVFLEILKIKKPTTNALIIDWHNSLFKETKSDIAGRFREYRVRVGDYRAPDWQDVKDLMNNFINYLNTTRLNPVELAARSHYKFEKIHPFGDGNGRVGRLLINYLLWHNNYPMLIIEYNKRKSYYKALAKDEDGFTDYFIRRYISVHRRRLSSKP